MGSKRELRLFACACCRRVGLRTEHRAAREVLLIAERFADGAALGKEAGPSRTAPK